MKKTIVYPASHVYYDGVLSAINSALANANVDEIWILTDGEPFPYPVPMNVHILDISCQQWIQRASPNWRNEFSFICLVRCAFGKLFPDYSRILSLDADTIITQDISELWDLDLTDYYMAGVPEVRLSAEKGYPYINAGMMMLNLDKIRRDGLDERMINDINRRRYVWVEQDCINENCCGSVLPLDSKYNKCFCTADCTNPKILHFAARPEWRDFPVAKYYRDKGSREVEPVVFYLCDGKKECGGKSGCFLSGGECNHTADPNHARIKDASERKEILRVGSDGKLHFWEFEDGESILPF